MSTELLVALISAAVALSVAALTVWREIKSRRLEAEFEKWKLTEERRIELEKALSRYREHLARAAYDLQSRLYNILEQGLISAYLVLGGERERTYVVENTVFLFAQYLAWTEIIRRDIQFIDLGRDEQTRQLARLQDEVYSLFQTDRFHPTFRIFAGEQRAIGERMVRKGASGSDCIGYGAFLDRATELQDPLLEHLREDVQNLSTRLEAARPRLIALQHALIDLLAFLDPDVLRFPETSRSKIEVA